MSFIVKQEKAKPNDWHVVAQSQSEQTINKVKMDIARNENSKFVVKKDGDVLGDKTDLIVFKDKSSFLPQ